MSDQHDSTLVVAIDIGTTYSGYAFSFGHEYKSNPLTITYHSWPDGPSYKTPTCVLLTPEKEFYSFGREAEDKYKNLAEIEDHKDWYFVTRFKMLLMGKRETKLKSSDKKIKWVLTVPAIWSDQAKQFMRMSAKEAGISDSFLTLAYEPEAAALYCGTADISINEVTHDNRIKTIDRASGGDWGGTNIDIKFLKFLDEVLGNNIMEEIGRDYRSDFLEIQQEFEEQKRKVTPDGGHDVVIRMPFGVMEVIKNKGKTIADIVGSSPHGNMVSVNDKQKNRLHIKARIFIGF
ncbi:unnamed protein product [Mytilus edulis]|uniref:Uncharacterized protein n=1 Tax=Mytilus edulis TaxID=6550 RepID=A0A8S3PM86_MYTED|nr:unnamed protein product [Mytilus edulis]